MTFQIPDTKEVVTSFAKSEGSESTNVLMLSDEDVRLTIAYDSKSEMVRVSCGPDDKPASRYIDIPVEVFATTLSQLLGWKL